jgi:hypothetical protein
MHTGMRDLMNKNLRITAELKFIISYKKGFKNSHPEAFIKDVQPTGVA